MPIFAILFFCSLLCCLVEKTAAQNCASSQALRAQELLDQGLEAYKRREATAAKDYIERAYELFGRTNCSEGQVRSSYNLLIALSQETERQSAKETQVLQKALKSSEQLADTALWRGKIHYIAGQFALQKGQYKEAGQAFRLAKKYYMLGAHWSDYIQSSRSLARLAHIEQDYSLMENHIDEAFRYNKEYLNNDKYQLRAILQLYGVLFFRTGDYEKALEKTAEGLKVVLQTMQNREDTLMAISYYNNMGSFYLELADIFKADDYFSYALDLARQLGDKYRLATIHQNIAQAYSTKDQDNKALENYRKGIELTKDLRPSSSISKTQIERSFINFNNGLAEVSMKGKYFGMALDPLLENQAIHARGETYKREETLRLLGEWYLGTKNYAQASEYLAQALAAHQKLYGNKHPLVARMYGLVGEFHRQTDNSTQALEYYMMAIEAMRTPLQSIDAMGPSAQEYYVSDRNLYLEILEKKAYLMRHNPLRMGTAYETIQLAVEQIELMRNKYKSEGSKLFLQQRVIPIYELAISLSLKHHKQTGEAGYLEEAFRLVERSRAMLLLDALKSEEARSFGDLPPELLQQERRLNREIAQSEKQILENPNSSKLPTFRKTLFRLRQEASALQDTIEDKYPKYYRLKYDERISKLSEIQERLQIGEQILEYFVGQEHIYLFSISKTRVDVFDWEKDNEHYHNSLSYLRTSLTSSETLFKDPERVFQQFTAESAAVYARFVAPALQAEKNKKLIILPDGLFNYIPFEVLLMEKPAEDAPVNFRKLPYLIRDYIIRYHYSASLLFFRSEQKKQSTSYNGRILGFAPTYSLDSATLAAEQDSRQRYIRSNVRPLPGAKQELDYLKTHYKGQYLFREEASEARFKEEAAKEAYSVLHLAMHGWVDANDPRFSNLVFSYQKNSKEDNLLHAYELNLLDLKTELLVLSACETGYGKYERGEGVASLGRGFMYAGVPSILMTLWPINDQVTAFLVAEFYKGLDDALNIDEALRQAKLRYLDQADALSAHPFYWASFVMLGEEKPVSLSRPWDWILVSLVLAFISSLLGLIYLTWFKR